LVAIVLNVGKDTIGNSQELRDRGTHELTRQLKSMRSLAHKDVKDYNLRVMH